MASALLREHEKHLCCDGSELSPSRVCLLLKFGNILFFCLHNMNFPLERRILHTTTAASVDLRL